MLYTIVKGKNWPHGFAGPVELDESAWASFSGREVGIKRSYKDVEEANKDCSRMNEYNPCGYYFVSEVY